MKAEVAKREIESLDYYLQNHTDDYSEESHTAMMMAISALSENKCFEGMTNGEVIQALFPELKVEIDGFLVRCVFIEHEFTTTEVWWNAPYKIKREVSE